jgi:branched-chain amino acid transport system substrate-binding protein
MSRARGFALAAAGALVALAALAQPPHASAQAKPPLKIGLLIPVTGVFAAPGAYMREGLELYLKEHHNQLAGRDVQVVTADDQGNPAVGLTEIRRLVEQEHVDVIFGPLSAAVGSALVPYIDQHKIPTIYPIVSSDDLTQRTPSDWIARTGWTSSQPTHVLADYAYKTLKYRTAATIAYDFNFGWESIGGFVDTFQRDGGKVVKQIWTPTVTPDYSSYLSAIPRNVDVVMCSFSGTAAVNFIHQYRAFGLKMPLICQGNTTDESTLTAEGPDAVGIITALQYSATLDTPTNKAFAAAYTAAYGHVPSYYAEGTYVGAAVLERGLDEVHGDTSDAAAFARALKHATLPNAPRGPISLDTYGNPVQNIYIRRVEQHGDRLENTVLQTYPHVSQFWTENPKDYLAHPVYSRTYPVCNACT